MIDIDVVVRANNIIGESPTWSPDDGALYWIDVKAPALFRIYLESGHQDRWDLSADIGGFTLLADGSGALVALRTGLHRLAFASGGLSLVAEPPFDPLIHRFNEGGCDPDGVFWIGVMFDPRDPNAPPQRGTLHSYSRANGLQGEPDQAELHNGMAWSVDGDQMFLSHSQRQEIYSFPYRGGQLGPKRLFATIPSSDGVPDGAAIDTDGGYWCALHGGGRLRRFHPDGKFDRDILLPVSQPTMCSFGGRALDELYVTTATDKLTAGQLREQPLAGSLLRLRPGERGIARRCTLA